METDANHRPVRLSQRESGLLESMFGDGDRTDEDFSLEIPDTVDSEGFEGVNAVSPRGQSGAVDPQRRMERTGNAFMETKMVPFTLMTDGNTAMQVVMLLEMIRYCMEGSKGIMDGGTGEAKEYDIHVKVRNRGKSNFVVSVGDEPMAPLPVSEEPWFIGS